MAHPRDIVKQLDAGAVALSCPRPSLTKPACGWSLFPAELPVSAISSRRKDKALNGPRRTEDSGSKVCPVSRSDVATSVLLGAEALGVLSEGPSESLARRGVGCGRIGLINRRRFDVLSVLLVFLWT